MEWISVEDRLPEATSATIHKESSESEVVFSVDHEGFIETAFYCYDMASWFTQDGSNVILGVTHWMPLPESPKAKE